MYKSPALTLVLPPPAISLGVGIDGDGDLSTGSFAHTQVIFSLGLVDAQVFLVSMHDAIKPDREEFNKFRKNVRGAREDDEESGTWWARSGGGGGTGCDLRGNYFWCGGVQRCNEISSRNRGSLPPEEPATR